MRIAITLFLLVFLPIFTWAASESLVPLEHAKIDLSDKASLQRGAKLYINYCLGCHSLSYLRYNRMAKDIGIVNNKGKVLTDLVKENLIFSGANISDTILSAMPELEAARWFGKAPPDLTLVARIRGADWIYTYLKSFYADPARPLGVNNLVFPDVAMPNVLVNLQGIQIPLYKTTKRVVNGKVESIKVISHLAIEQPGSMSEAEFDSAINDLTNFLAYAAAPETSKRHFIGYWVIGFLLIFAILTYFLKREYWRDIKK